MHAVSQVHYLPVVWLTNMAKKCFFQKNKIENFKTVSNGLFTHAPLMFWKKIDTAASNREAVNNFEIWRALWWVKV